MAERYVTTRHHPISIPNLLLLTVAILLSCALRVAAGTPGSPFGQHFMFAFPDTTQHLAPIGNQPPVAPTATIVIFTLDTTRVQVTGPRYQRTFTVTPGKSEVIVPPTTLTWQTNSLSQGMYDITADHDIAIYCYYTTAYGSEAFRPLPVASWGTDYFVMSLVDETITNIRYNGDEESLGFKRAPGEILIVASEFTQVYIRYAPATGAPDGSYQLQGGDVLLLELPESALALSDLSGTHITSTRPVGVITGNTRSSAAGLHVLGPEIPSPMMNSLIEWLPPVSSYGTTFAYRQLSPFDGTKVTELIRVYGCGPGITNVIDTRTGTPHAVAQGSYVELPSNTFDAPTIVPFKITTSQPAEAVVITAPYAEPSDPLSIIQFSYNLWGAAMSELVPAEKWINSGRFYAPSYPPALMNYVTIVAETGAAAWLDGKQIVWDPTPYPLFPYHQAEIAVQPGDHSIVARGGTFSAIAYGQAQGFNEYKPVATRKKDNPAISRPHPSVYSERMVVSYAYPVSGLVTPGSDSIDISIVEACDSTIALAVRHPGAGDLVPLTSAQLDPASVNTDAVILPLYEAQQLSGYRVRFSPRNPAAPATGKVVITNAQGRRWELPFQYTPQILTVSPNPLDLNNVLANALQTSSATLKNTGPGNLTVRSVRLAKGSAGFSLPDLHAIPKLFAPGDTLNLPVDFFGTLYGITYRDTLVVQTDCRTILIPLSAHTKSIVPGPEPHIDGYDWHERWLTTLNPCTRSGIGGYEAAINIYNAGGARFTVKSLTLVGADADSGYFQFGSPPPVAPGDTIGAGESRTVGVIFHPAAERAYACRVRLITVEGDTVEADLAGIGIETHEQIDDHDFGSVVFTPGVQIAGTVELRALPTRPLEVRGLRIVGADRTSFAFAAGFVAPDEAIPSTWWHMLPGEKRSIALVFMPESEGIRTAEIEVIGDESACDDTVGALTARTVLAGVTAPDVDFGSILGCARRDSTVMVRNTGNTLFSLESAVLLDSGSFTLDTLALPAELKPDSAIAIGAHFHPASDGADSARVRFVLRLQDGSGQLDTVTAVLRGASHAIVARARMRRDYRSDPGATVEAVIWLDDTLDAAQVTELVIRLPLMTHATIVKDATAGGAVAMVNGTLLAGWSVSVDAGSPDTIRLRAKAPSGQWLRGAGELLRLNLSTFLQDSIGSEVPFSVEVADGACAAVTAEAGRVQLDSICGLRQRLIESTGMSYTLDGNHPNPFNPTTEIQFSLGLDGPTRLAVYDMRGREVAVLVDSYLGAGMYSVQWDASRYPSGAYRYRLTSGAWSGEGAMVLRK